MMDSNENTTNRFNKLTQAIRRAFGKTTQVTQRSALTLGQRLVAARTPLITLALVGGAGYWLWQSEPIISVAPGEVSVRTNTLTGTVTEHGEGTLIALPGLHHVRAFPLRDQLYDPATSHGDDSAPFQSVEGLSFGAEMSVRYAIDPKQLSRIARSLPDDINDQVVQPTVQGAIYKVLTRYTVREIFSTKRGEIQQVLEEELKPKLAADGILLRSVQLGKVHLPEDYRRGMDKLLSEELATAKMRYTLELKEKQIKETELEGEAQRVRREKNAMAAAGEQLIAAKAQEEAMKHVLPFKQKQIEQRQLEAEAEKQARVRGAEANAQSRRIEAQGEADSRQKLADAEAYRLQRVGKVNSEQMERDGAVITKHPLLIQKALADKLSDKITVIVAPTGTDGSLISASFLGAGQQQARATPATHEDMPARGEGEQQ
jgi:regulator of protease activity HflC (stomatin/prohibitin superfamily)